MRAKVQLALHTPDANHALDLANQVAPYEADMAFPDILSKLPKAPISGAVVDRGITCQADPCDAAKAI
jgi:hypothetical protein